MSGENPEPIESASRTTQMAQRIRARTAQRLEAQGEVVATTRASRQAGLLVLAVLLGIGGLSGVLAGAVTGGWAGVVSGVLLIAAAVLLARVSAWMPLLVPGADDPDVRRRARTQVLRAVALVGVAVLVAAIGAYVTA